jgi:hypothetical protein
MVKIITYIIVSCFVLFFAYGLYKYTNRNCNLKELPCHKEVVVFDKIYKEKLISTLIKQIEAGHYTLKTTAQKAVYTKSDLFEYITVDGVDEIVHEALDGYKNNDSNEEDKSLHVNVLIYENDKNDPGKKNQQAKVYRGYLVFSFLLENTLVYKVQIDFMDYKGQDIPKRVSCALQTLLNYKKVR